jgi:hypothetical protein
MYLDIDVDMDPGGEFYGFFQIHSFEEMYLR